MADEPFTQNASRDPLLDRAQRLFTFLGSAQQLKTKPPRTVETYERDGSVLWLGDLPDHPAIVSVHRVGEPDPADAVLTIDRVPRKAPQEPGSELAAWLDGRLDDPNRSPELRTSISVIDEEASALTAEGEPAPSRRLALDGHPEISEQYEQWLVGW